MKTFISALLLATAAGGPLLATQPQITKFKLVPDESAAAFYDGTVEYARTAVISFESPGHLTFVAPVGRYVVGEVLDSDGNIVAPGGLLAQQDLKIPQADVDIAEVMLKRADAVLEDSELNYKRDKDLAEKSAVSIREFQETQMLYTTAIRDKSKAELELERAKRVLETCTRYSPFNAVVTETYLSVGGSADTGDPVLKISMIDPIRVRFSLPPEARLKLNDAARILVYPVGTDEPAVGWLEQPVLSTSAMFCYVDNPRSAGYVLMPDGTQLPSVDALNPVRAIAAKQAAAPLWAAEETVHHDDKGHFVWRLNPPEPQPDGRTDGSEVFTLERVEVELADLQIRYGYMLLRGLKAGSALKDGDLLAGDVPEDAVSGTTVIYRQKFHPFQVGDKVKVRLDEAQNAHKFSIPAAALHKNQDNAGRYVMVEQQGTPRQIPVTVLGWERQNAWICCPEWTVGMELRLASLQ